MLFLSWLTPILPSYSTNGAQINRPEDGEIARSIRENLEPWPTAWKDLQPSDLLHADSYQKLLPHYICCVETYAVSYPSRALRKTRLTPSRNQRSQSGSLQDQLSTHLFMVLEAWFSPLYVNRWESITARLFLLKRNRIPSSLLSSSRTQKRPGLWIFQLRAPIEKGSP